MTSILDQKKNTYLETFFNIYNYFCLHEFDKKEWNIISDRMFLSTSSNNLLTIFLYCIDQIDLSESFYFQDKIPNIDLPENDRIEYIFSLLLNLNEKEKKKKDIDRLKKNKEHIQWNDILHLSKIYDISIFNYNNMEETWESVEPSEHISTNFFFLYQQKDGLFYRMFPILCPKRFEKYIPLNESKDSSLPLKNFFHDSKKTIEFFQKIVKTYCFEPPTEKNWYIIPSETNKQSPLECFLLASYSFDIPFMDSPSSFSSLEKNLISLKNTILHHKQFFLSQNELHHEQQRLLNNNILEDDLKLLCDRNAIWCFIFHEEKPSNPFQEKNGYWDFKFYKKDFRHILFFLHKNKHEYHLINPKHILSERIPNRKKSFYQKLKEDFKNKEQEENSHENQIKRYHQKMTQKIAFTEKIIDFMETKPKFISIPSLKYKTLLEILQKIDTTKSDINIQHFSSSGKNAFYSNNFSSEIDKIIETQNEKNTIIFFDPTYNFIIKRKEINNSPSEKIIFFYKKTPFFEPSDKWNKNEFEYVSFPKPPSDLESKIESIPHGISSQIEKTTTYDTMKVKDLISLCREKNIPLKSYKKEFLIEKLKENQKKSSSSSTEKKSSSTEKIVITNNTSHRIQCKILYRNSEKYPVSLTLSILKGSSSSFNIKNKEEDKKIKCKIESIEIEGNLPKKIVEEDLYKNHKEKILSLNVNEKEGNYNLVKNEKEKKTKKKISAIDKLKKVLKKK